MADLNKEASRYGLTLGVKSDSKTGDRLVIAQDGYPVRQCATIAEVAAWLSGYKRGFRVAEAKAIAAVAAGDATSSEIGLQGLDLSRSVGDAVPCR